MIYKMRYIIQTTVSWARLSQSPVLRGSWTKKSESWLGLATKRKPMVNCSVAEIRIRRTYVREISEASFFVQMCRSWGINDRKLRIERILVTD